MGKKSTKTATCKEINIFRLVDFIVCVYFSLHYIIVPSNLLRPLPMCVCEYERLIYAVRKELVKRNKFRQQQIMCHCHL